MEALRPIESRHRGYRGSRPRSRRRFIDVAPTLRSRLSAPIVLVHGLFGFSRVGLGRLGVDYFRGIPGFLREGGHRVIAVRIHPTAGIALRSSRLAMRLRTAIGPDEPFHLIGHSQGGLDARALLTDRDWAARALSLTTIGTPHLGSALAESIGRRLDRLYGAISRCGWDCNGLVDVTPRRATEFHRATAPPPGVPCFSLAGAPARDSVCAAMRPSFAWLERLEGPNDGLVTAESALAFGTPLGTWPLDHFQQLNWFARGGHDPRALYAAIVDALAARGFAADAAPSPVAAVA